MIWGSLITIEKGILKDVVFQVSSIRNYESSTVSIAATEQNELAVIPAAVDFQYDIEEDKIDFNDHPSCLLKEIVEKMKSLVASGVEIWY